MENKKGVLVLAHGSREKETERTLTEIEIMVKELLPDVIIETAYLQFCEKTLEKGLESLIEKGIHKIKVVPYFLFSGIHIREDIPAEISEFLKDKPNIKITMGKTLGADHRLAEILADRIKDEM